MSNQGPVTKDNKPEIAFYYPNPMSLSVDWVKSPILFFDGIALLVPSHNDHHRSLKAQRTRRLRMATKAEINVPLSPLSSSENVQ